MMMLTMMLTAAKLFSLSLPSFSPSTDLIFQLDLRKREDTLRHAHLPQTQSSRFTGKLGAPSPSASVLTRCGPIFNTKSVVKQLPVWIFHDCISAALPPSRTPFLKAAEAHGERVRRGRLLFQPETPHLHSGPVCSLDSVPGGSYMKCIS